jgi:hypothetical protein
MAAAAARRRRGGEAMRSRGDGRGREEEPSA